MRLKEPGRRTLGWVIWTLMGFLLIRLHGSRLKPYLSSQVDHQAGWAPGKGATSQRTAFRYRLAWTVPLTLVVERFRGRREGRAERVRADVRVVAEKQAESAVVAGELPDYVRTYQPQPEVVMQVQQRSGSIQRERFQEQITRIREELQVRQEARVEHQQAPAFVKEGHSQRAPPWAGVGAWSSVINTPPQRPRA